MKKVFSYYRVSSKDQEETGVSLDAQRDANSRYAQANQLEIVKEFREVQSASKGVRKEFEQMIKECQKRSKEISGVIFHDVDRSARTWKDWASVHELRDNGVSIYFSREAMEMDGRGNMLTADVKAAIAADQIRNLRQEVKKGLYRKLEEGFAVVGKPPVGYLAKGGGIREVDQQTAPFIKEAFRLYASGKYSLEMLADKMYTLGLRSRSGRKLEKEKMSRLLKNRFYIGLIEVKGKVFTGKHESLIPVALFEKVQAQMNKRSSPKTQKNEYKFLHILTCGLCNKPMRTSTAKHKYQYYGCRNKACNMSLIKETEVEKVILAELEKIKFSPKEVEGMLQIIKDSRKSLVISLKEREKAITLILDNTKARLNSLIDMQLSNPLPEEICNTKRNQLVSEEQKHRSQLAELQHGESKELKGLEELIHLLQDPTYAYRKANAWNKAQLIQRIMKNISFTPTEFFFEWETPMDIIARRNS